MVVDPFIDFEAQIAWDECLRFVPLEIVDVAFVRALDFQHIPKTPGRDQANLRSGSLDDQIRHEGGAVQEVRDLIDIEALLRERVQEPFFRGMRRGGRFRALDRARGLVDIAAGPGVRPLKESRTRRVGLKAPDGL